MLPGRMRQSTTISHRAGITFRLPDACAIVGATVNESSGSTSSAASGCSARARSSASSTGGTSPSTTCRNPCDLRDQLARRHEPAERLDQPRRLDERVVGDSGHRRVPAAAVDAQAEGSAHLLGRREEVDGLPTEHHPLAAALVERVVASHRVGMRLHEPLEAEAVTDLLVGRGGKDHVAGRAEPLPRQRCECDRRGRHMALHVERAPAPDDVVDEVARPRVAVPLRRVREHGVGVADQCERRPVAARQPRDEVRPLRHLGVQRRLDAVPGQVVAQQLGRARLVPGRIDRVQADQRLQQPGDLLAWRHAGGAGDVFESAVSSFRACQSSGKKTLWISRPSTSTGVPWVPTTASPMIRATTL